MTGLIPVVFLLLGAPQASAPADRCAELSAEASRITGLHGADVAAGIAAARSGLQATVDAGCTVARAGMLAALAENLEAAGRREEAIASYRDAVAVLLDRAEAARELDRIRLEGEADRRLVARQRLWLAGVVTALALLAVTLIAILAWYRESHRHARIMERVARTDELTGLPNRRDARDRIGYELGRAARGRRPFSLALLDLDDFKAINDTFGHDMGDRVLRAVVDRIRRRLRGQDILARWGGDELLILLPETDVHGAELLARMLDRGLANEPIRVDGLALVLTASIGVVECAPGDDVDACVRAADQAMYQAKRARKEQLEIGLDQ